MEEAKRSAKLTKKLIMEKRSEHFLSNYNDPFKKVT